MGRKLFMSSWCRGLWNVCLVLQPVLAVWVNVSFCESKQLILILLGNVRGVLGLRDSYDVVIGKKTKSGWLLDEQSKIRAHTRATLKVISKGMGGSTIYMSEI